MKTFFIYKLYYFLVLVKTQYHNRVHNSKRLIHRNDCILYYDCTNFFFKIEEVKGIRQYGFSKKHRPNPLVQWGCLDADDLPFAFSLHPGSTNEQETLKPLEPRIIQDDGQYKACVIRGWRDLMVWGDFI